jgi:hypothetical protein
MVTFLASKPIHGPFRLASLELSSRPQSLPTRPAALQSKSVGTDIRPVSSSAPMDTWQYLSELLK